MKNHLVVKILLIIPAVICLLFVLGILVKFLSIDRSREPLVTRKIEINDSMQWISLSAEPAATDKPVLLFLHGGPGSANLALLDQLVPQLSNHAVVVNWDQRLSGKSFSLFLSPDSLSLEQIIADAHVLTGYLKEWYAVPQIHLAAFSAGTVPGIMLIDRYPEDYAAYISIAQMVDGQRSEILSLEHTRETARKRADDKALNRLNSIDFDFSCPENILASTMAQRRYLLAWGGVYHSFTSYDHEALSLWRSPEYSFIDFLFWPYASSLSLRAMWHEIVLTPIDTLVPEVAVSVVFFCGRYDMNTPTSLIEEYYNGLKARAGKDLVIFENSAHSLFWDEPERFYTELVGVLQKQAHAIR